MKPHELPGTLWGTQDQEAKVDADFMSKWIKVVCRAHGIDEGTVARITAVVGVPSTAALAEDAIVTAIVRERSRRAN